MKESSSLSPLSARDQIVEKARTVVEVYAAARGASRGRPNPYSSLTALLQQAVPTRGPDQQSITMGSDHA